MVTLWYDMPGIQGFLYLYQVHDINASAQRAPNDLLKGPRMSLRGVEALAVGLCAT